MARSLNKVSRRIKVELKNLIIPKGKFAILQIFKDGQEDYLCGLFDNIEQARSEKLLYESRAPFFATMRAKSKGENLDHRTLMDRLACLRYLGMSFIIYNDKKQLVH